MNAQISFIMFKIVGGLKHNCFELQAISENQAISVAQDFYERNGLIGRYYCETSTGKTFSIT